MQKVEEAVIQEKPFDKKRKAALPLWARIVLVIISYLLLAGIFQAIGMAIAGIPITDINSLKNISLQQQLVSQLSTIVALMFIVYVFRKLIDKESISSLGFSVRNRLTDIAAGLVMALTLMGSGTLILYLLGYVDFSNIQLNVQTLSLSLVVYFLVALNEEILLRGYILNNLLTKMNKYLALVISALVFTAIHLLNFNLSSVALINLFLAGVLLGAAYIFTKNLWFPISLHLFWNYFQGPVFGYAVSGHNTESLFSLTTNGNKIMHGGEFGFEGSVLCTLLTMLSVLLVLRYYQIKNNPRHFANA